MTWLSVCLAGQTVCPQATKLIAANRTCLCLPVSRRSRRGSPWTDAEGSVSSLPVLPVNRLRQVSDAHSVDPTETTCLVPFILRMKHR